ncbi:MAG: hypothetical protein RLZZ558_120 [Planctomycetota bacterium]|jgi:ferritin-like metal-binding protein YciE
MPLNTLEDLFARELSTLVNAEKQSLAVLEKLQKASDASRLAKLLASHVEETREHVARLDRVFVELDIKPRNGGSGGMKGLRQDCIDLAGMPGVEPHVRDAAIIAAAQHLEHDEIASYGCARTWARLLGHRNAASALQKSLEEERAFDEKLSKLAETLNKAALEPELASG